MPPTADRKAFFKLARDRYKQGTEATKDQRQREKDDLEFYAGEQWPGPIKASRSGMAANANGNGLPPVPARPTITINKTREPVRQVLNQERESDMGIEIVPADDFGEIVGPIDETEIELREGLIRRIQRASEAGDARTWAFARAVIAGEGNYGVMTRYVPGKTNDQEVYIRRFFNQSAVVRDPAHEQPDGSDAEWVFVGTDLPWDVYKAEYSKRGKRKNAVLRTYSNDEWRQLGEEKPGWYTSEGDLRMVRVVEYWYTHRTTRELVTYQSEDGEQETTEWADEVPEAPEGWVEAEDGRRTVTQKQIKWAKIDGSDDDVLEETDWNGPDMPIVKVLGEELQPFDDKRRVEGMVRPMREPGQMYNFMVSTWVERIGQTALSPIMMAEGQDEGYEKEWDAIATRALGRVHYKQRDLEGNPAPEPQVPPNRDAQVQSLVASVQIFDEAIQATSGIHDPSLGKVDPSVKSGRAIKALQEQSQRSSNHFLDNLQRSIRYEGQIINNLLYPIYGRPGRVARLLNKEGDAESVLLHQPMVRQGGKPVPAREDDANAKTYTLTKDAQFNVLVKVSKSYDSRREQEAAILGDLLQAEPSLMTWFGDLFFKNQDGPGHQEMADRAKVMLDPKIQQQLSAKASGQNVPPELQAQMTQLQQQNQQLQQQVQELSKPGAVEQIKQQGQAAIKNMELQSEAVNAQADRETKIAVAELGAKVDRIALFLEERARIGLQDQAAHDRAHEVGMAAMQHAQMTQQAQAAQDAEAQSQDASQQHDAAMAAQAQAAQAAQPQAPAGGQ